MSIITQLPEVVPGCVGAAENSDGTYRLDFANGTSRLATDAEVLQAAIASRVVDLKIEVEQYIDAGIKPVTRDMLRDGVLSATVADAVREFIADCYTECNSTMDAVEAVAVLAEVDDPAPIYPVYGA